MNKPHQGSPQLLVVDDEPEICELINYAATSVGYEVISTDDAAQVPALYSSDLEVIVLDLAMPGLDGVEIIRFLADKGSNAGIIPISGFDQGVLKSAGMLADGQGLNVIGTLTKPISIKDLKALLKNLPAVSRKEQPLEIVADLSLHELRTAIADRALIVHYQPKVHIATRTLKGVEALVRWRHPKGGIVLPGKFVPMAEENGLINDLTTIVVEKAVKQCAAWSAAGLVISISLNFSALTLTDLDIPDRLSALVKKSGLKPSQIVIEVTETSVFHELMTSLDILTRLRMKGFRLSIDDFGTGHSSLGQLQNVPFTELKIDQTFVKNSNSKGASRSIVESAMQLGHKLGMNVVAEGVETQATWDLLAEIGCDEAQGYFLGRPMPAEELEAWLQDWK